MEPSKEMGQSANQPVDATLPQAVAPSPARLTRTTTSSYVYALGRVTPRFSGLAVEKEFAQVTGRAVPAGLTDRLALQSVLSERANRYLARQLCWVLETEGLEPYLLVPRDPVDFDLLVETLRPTPSPLDVDVVVGVLGPIAPPEMCNGLTVPIVAFDQIYSFDRDALIKAIPRPEKVTAKEFEPTARELFDRIMQMADNAGATDEDRALNYLAVRYPAIYATAVDAFGRNASLTAVTVRPSPLSGTRKIVDVIFSYTNRNTDVMEKFFVCVDVSEEFPFLVTRLSPYDEEIKQGRIPETVESVTNGDDKMEHKEDSPQSELVDERDSSLSVSQLETSVRQGMEKLDFRAEYLLNTLKEYESKTLEVLNRREEALSRREAEITLQEEELNRHLGELSSKLGELVKTPSDEKTAAKDREQEQANQQKGKSHTTRLRAAKIADRVAQAGDGGFREIAASQIVLSQDYYDEVLMQAKRSFWWALVAAFIGIVFFLVASGLILWRQESVASVSLISGVVVELISGIGFALYARASRQLATFHINLDRMMFFLFANTICEHLGSERKDPTRADLVRTIADYSNQHYIQYEKQGRERSKAADRPDSKKKKEEENQ